ncbi:MAG TPA: 4-hydroxythreonine-4-phosphate dehydrogenase [Blastocatellia bacterium]|nr:4-hydroxythreonine-4-phosphate dehydrogenase [Blastocatellia bacterium]
MPIKPEFIFMLTKNDMTVPDALERVVEIADLPGLSIIGFKDIGLPIEDLGKVVSAIRDSDRVVAMEVVSLNENDELRSARAAVTLKVDMLLGGTRAEQVSDIIRDKGIKYFPFPGEVIGHPSVLAGTLDEIVGSACRLASLPGVHGLDLLAYRWSDGDPAALTRAVVDAAGVPVVAAGDINCAERVRDVAEAGVYGFTVGSAAFDGKFAANGGLAAQLQAILDIV